MPLHIYRMSALTACFAFALTCLPSLGISETKTSLVTADPENTQVKLSAIDYADAGTTAALVAIMGDAVTEANPIAGAAGDAAAPILGLGMKYGMKKFLVHRGASVCKADRAVGIGSALGACNNILVFAGATTPISLAAGAACAAIYAHAKKCSPPEFILEIPDDQLVELELVRSAPRPRSLPLSGGDR